MYLKIRKCLAEQPLLGLDQQRFRQSQPYTPLIEYQTLNDADDTLTAEENGKHVLGKNIRLGSHNLQNVSGQNEVMYQLFKKGFQSSRTFNCV